MAISSAETRFGLSGGGLDPMEPWLCAGQGRSRWGWYQPKGIEPTGMDHLTHFDIGSYYGKHAGFFSESVGKA